MAEANVCKSPDIGDYFEVDPESRVEKAHVHFGPTQDEPVTPFRCLPKLDVDDDAVIGEIFYPHQPSQDPYEEVGVKVLVAEITARPLVTPSSQRLNDRTERPAGVGEVILGTSSVCERFSLDNADMGQGVEALAKQITGYARHASVDVGEAQRAGQQLPQNQGCPALGENLGGKCYGTKLAIPLHAVQHDRIVVSPQVQFLN